MMTPALKRSRSRNAGAAAVELAILLPILFVFLTIPLFFGRYFWHYSVANKAAHDAARYLSTISVREMRSATLSAAAGQVALDIASEEIADLHPGSGAPTIQVYCGPSKQCIGVGSSSIPLTVIVKIDLDMVDDIFGAVNTGFYGWRITAQAELPYVGR
jgi:hypothetical protein